jgi:hypothetical protein
MFLIVSATAVQQLKLNLKCISIMYNLIYNLIQN